jgi:hypothetical protein
MALRLVCNTLLLNILFLVTTLIASADIHLTTQ